MIKKRRFRELARPLTAEEKAVLEESIVEEGVRDPVVIWRDILIDGHNREEIATRHSLHIPVKVMDFDDEDAAERWAIRNQLARRNLEEKDFRLLLGRLYNSEKKAPHRPEKKGDTVSPLTEKTSEKLGREHGVSGKTVKRAGKVAEAYEAAPKSAKCLYDGGKLTDAQLRKISKMEPDEAIQACRDVRTGRRPAKEAIDTGPVRDKAYFKRQAERDLDRVMRDIDDIHRDNEDHKRHAECFRLLDKLRAEVAKW